MPAVIGLCGALIVAVLTVGSNVILAVNSRRFSAEHAWEEKQLEARRSAYSKVLMHMWRLDSLALQAPSRAWIGDRRSELSPSEQKAFEDFVQAQFDMNDAIAESVLLLSIGFRQRAYGLRVDLLEMTREEDKRNNGAAASETLEEAEYRTYRRLRDILREAQSELEEIALRS